MQLFRSILPLVLIPALSGAFANMAFTNRVLGDEAGGWHASGANRDEYEMGIDSSVVRSGKGAGFIRSKKDDTAGWGTWMQTFDAAPFRGKSVQFTAWLKKNNSGAAALWMRVDGNSGVLSFDNMQDRPITGTIPWTRYSLVLEVPSESRNIALGVMLHGPGEVWIDDCALAEAAADSSHESAGNAGGLGDVTGLVRDDAGAAVRDAFVALVSPTRSDPADTTRSGSDGRFKISAPPGLYGLTVTFPGLEAIYLDSVRVAPGASVQTADLAFKKGGATIQGTVSAPGQPVPAGTLVKAARFSDMAGDLFCTTTDSQGRYVLTLPAQYKYMLAVTSEKFETPLLTVEADRDQVADVKLTPLEQPAAPPSVVSWLRKNAVPLKTVEAGHGFEDMEPLRRMVGDAHLVCLGEATHGTREFFQLKHRVLEFLASEMGFTVFGIEATFPESFDVNRYVLTGEGDPAAALANLYFWTWNTEEVLDMIRWMRMYNQDPAHVQKLKFYGFDMQFPQNAIQGILDYLGRVDPVRADSVKADLQALQVAWKQSRDLPVGIRIAATDADRRVLGWFDSRKDAYSRQTSADEWDIARQHARVLEQFLALVESRTASGNVRDAAMAENIRWILRHEGPGTRMVAWAHNGHVSTGEDQQAGSRPMGSYLREALGPDMAVFGFAFDQGSFRAVAGGAGAGGLRTFTVNPAPDGTLEQTLARVGVPVAAVDLRVIPASGEVGDWFAHPHRMRSIGAVFDPEGELRYFTPVTIQKDFDVLLFVAKTTASREVETPGDLPRYADRPLNLDFESAAR